MSARFAELAFAPTRMGDVSLRRRRDPVTGLDVHEVLLGEEFLMSSLFTVAEVALADLGLAATPGTDLDVVVGGLGLGWTARAALEDPRVRRLDVVDALPAVIDWHHRALLPHAEELTGDPRARLVEGDFFALTAGDEPYAPDGPAVYDAVLLDVDHSPRHVLDPSHAPFYTADGLRRLAARLAPGGVFALWSDDPPDAPFLDVLREVLDDVDAHVVPFANPYTGGESSNTVYVARRR
ncbi:MAG: spermidine synthase [Frankiales bacterium]|nr:spermidine synthase [Frankiales bacterium]